jgi:hypothetical protein
MGYPWLTTILLISCLSGVSASIGSSPTFVVKPYHTDCPTAFGLANLVLGLRGGEVIEATSAEVVEDAIVKAGAEQTLVVIDFTATWCGPW